MILYIYSLFSRAIGVTPLYYMYVPIYQIPILYIEYCILLKIFCGMGSHTSSYNHCSVSLIKTRPRGLSAEEFHVIDI